MKKTTSHKEESFKQSRPPLAVVIMAGGAGTRLWPLSRKENPKQFHDLTGSGRTLLQETYDRALTVAAPTAIFVCTTEHYRTHVAQQLPDLSPDHILTEPAARNTAPAIYYASACVVRRLPDHVIATIAADHAIKNPEAFTAAITTAAAAAAAVPDAMITIGIKPTFPDTRLGYIKMGEEIPGDFSQRIFAISAFKEKPGAATAKEYLADWSYLWNAGYFIFSPAALRAHLQHYAPHIVATIDAFANDDSSPSSKEAYASLPDTPIDTVLMEQLPDAQRIVVPSALQWSDIGSWDAVYDFFANSTADHCVVHASHVGLDTTRTLVMGDDRLIATFGIEDLVIIDTPDALLVTHRRCAPDLKKIIALVREKEASLL